MIHPTPILEIPREWPVLAPAMNARPVTKGKFLFLNDKKLYLRGVTYGPFRPEEVGGRESEYHTPRCVAQDFALMAHNGINAIRTYTVPPGWLLDVAQAHGLWVLVGLPWEQHVTFLDEKERVRSIEERVRAGVRKCLGHPALLGYTIGNEIPASIVRWYGRRPVEQFLKRLYGVAKNEDPDALVTYVNYPTTEYLQLPFLDLACFNVYLESHETLEAYLARLQNLAGERPLLMAEIGLDSRRNGEVVQAETLDWQVRTAFTAGCTGAFVFSWTDEWYRGGHDIDDWDFGLTTRRRTPKPALAALKQTFGEEPFPTDRQGSAEEDHISNWPRISVVVCSYNGACTIDDCCQGLAELDYPDFEVIIVDDGSSDGTAAIAGQYGFRILRTKRNQGLSHARNLGLEAASGEIVAYLDDDARPDPHWLRYLALAFLQSDDVGVGGPNLPPPDDGFIAGCVANTPGGPAHVLLSDRRAEHIPGCNMAFRRAALEAIGGFDPQFRIAGDDVDVCWRLQQQGGTLGYSAAAVVWHHRRNSVAAFWRQQRNYGRAEALLEAKWPEKYNALGHLVWQGRLYSAGLGFILPFARWRIYHGVWGSRPFQPLTQAPQETFWLLPSMPEWYLILGVLFALSLLGRFWQPMFGFLPLFLAAAGLSLLYAVRGTMQVVGPPGPESWQTRLKRHGLTAGLYLLQPLARLWGRLHHGLSPWRRAAVSMWALPRLRVSNIWSEQWQAAETWLAHLEEILKGRNGVVVRGGDYDGWDLEIRGGVFTRLRVLMAIEEHGAGRQFVRLRSWPYCSPAAIVAVAFTALLSILAAFGQAWAITVLFGLLALLLGLWIYRDGAVATSLYLISTEQVGGKQILPQAVAADARTMAEKRRVTI